MTERLLPRDIDFSAPHPGLSRRLRLGVVGGGRIARIQAMAARMSGLWDVVAGAFSSDPAKAGAGATEWHVARDRSYPSFAEMAAREAARPDGVEAVMITTPNNLHCPAATSFLKAGIDVLCDKPMTNEVGEAEALVARTRETGCVFGVSYVMSCYPMVREARSIVASGALGRINQVHVEFMQDWMIPDGSHDAPHARWRLDPAVSGPTSCVGDIGTHAAHLAGFVSGLELTHLRADLHVCGAPKRLEDTAFMATRHAGSVPGTLLATRLATGNRGGLRLRVFGSEAGIEWDMEKCERLKLSRYGEPDRIVSRGHGHGVSQDTERLVRTARGFPEGIVEAWANLYTEFAMAVAARRDRLSVPDGWLSLPSVEDGALGVRFIHAAVHSNAAGGAWRGV